MIPLCRVILLKRVQWDPESKCDGHLCVGHLESSDANFISIMFRRMFCGGKDDILRHSFSKFLTNCLYKFTSVNNPRLYGVPVNELRSYFVYLAKEIHRVVVSCDISEWTLDNVTLLSRSNENHVCSDIIPIPTCDVVYQELCEIAEKATEHFYPINQL